MMFRYLRLMVLMLLPLAVTQALAQAGPLVEAIEEIDANVLFLRHALAPGFGDPGNFSIDDCSTQRNLDAAGRQQSRRLGAYLRDEGLVFDEILSSRWCRCVDTAAEMGIGDFATFDGLNSFFDGHVDREATLALLAKRLAEFPGDGLVLMVTHQVVISAVTGIPPQSGGFVAYNSRTGEARRAGTPVRP